MQDVEQRIKAVVLRGVRGPNPEGTIVCKSADGMVGVSGGYEYGRFFRKSADFATAFPFNHKNPEADLSWMLQELREASKSAPEGPWYRLNIHVRGKDRCEFEYFWEGTPVDRLADLERDTHGQLPTFPFRTRFDAALISQLDASQVHDAVTTYAELPRPLAEWFAVYDWMADTANGAMNQFFAREGTYMGGSAQRTDLFPLILAGLERAGLDDAAALYRESIALYAHFYERVEAAREALGIPAVERQEESDIMDRYYAMDRDIQERLGDYFVANSESFAVPSEPRDA